MSTQTLEETLSSLITCGTAATKIVQLLRNTSALLNRDEIDHLHRFLLYAATIHNRRDLLKLLLIDCGSYLNASPRPLFIAIYSGNLPFVKLLIKAGSTINSIDPVRTVSMASAIEIACIYDQPEIFEFLYGPRTKQRSTSRRCALHIACHHGALKCVDYLLTTDVGRADVNVFKHVNYVSVTHYNGRYVHRCHYNEKKRPRTPVLPASKPLLTRKLRMPRTSPPTYFSIPPFFSMPIFPRNACRNMFMPHPCTSMRMPNKTVHKQRPEQSTPMILGLVHGAEMVAKLLAAGASVSYQTVRHRRTVLHIAVDAKLEDQSEVLRLLIRAGVPLDERDSNGNTALNNLIAEVSFYHCYHSNNPRMVVDCVRDLLAGGAHHDSIDRWIAIEHLMKAIRRIKIFNSRLPQPSEEDMWRFTFKMSLEIVLLLYAREINDALDTSSNLQKFSRYDEDTLLSVMVQDVIVIAQDSRRAHDFEMMMNGLCDLVRCCILSGNTTILYGDLNNLLPMLLKSSAKPSLKLLRILLSALDERRLSELKSVFSEDAIAVELLQNVKRPRRLMYLARAKIIDVMRWRAVRGVCTLGLPRTLEDYVLLKE